MTQTKALPLLLALTVALTCFAPLAWYAGCLAWLTFDGVECNEPFTPECRDAYEQAHGV
jgi:hypothetical protein